MAQQNINYGAAPNDGTGDLYRNAMIKVQNNFTDLYTNKVDKAATIALTGGATGTATALAGATVVIPITDLNMGSATAGTLAVARGGTGVTTSTGTGSTVLSASPALTGTPTVPTAATATNNTQIASTAFVQAVNSADTGSSATAVTLKTARTFAITGGATAAAQTFNGGANVALNVTALDMSVASAGTLAVARGGTGTTTSTGTGSTVLSASPALTGAPLAPTAAATVNNTQIASTAFVRRESASPTVAPTYSFAGFGVESVMSKFGWTTGDEWAWALDANGSIGWRAYNKGVWLSKPFTFEKNGNINIIGSLQTSGRTPSLAHSGEIGSSFGEWTGGAIPVIRIDAADQGSAYMLWRVTRPKVRHVAAMHVHETTANDSSIMTSLSMAGGTNQHIWYGSGMYWCKGNVSAAGVVLTSDERLKDIKYHVVGALEKVRLMDKVYYTMKGSTEVKLGYTASSVKKGLPEAVSQRDAREEEKPYTGDRVNVVDYNAVSVLHGAAIDELHAMVKALREELAELRRGK